MDDLQAVEGVFTPTRTILSSAPMFGIPEVLLDEAHGLWSIRQPGMEQASVFRCADIASCEVEEIEAEVTPAPEGLRGLGEVFLNPMGVSRGNAARRKNRIYGVNVVVSMKMPDVDPIRIKLWMRELKRGTRAYRNVMESAVGLKGDFDEMAGGGNG